MRCKAYLLIAVVTFLGTASCKKDTATSVAYPIQGLWVGTYTDANQVVLYITYSIYPDGTISTESLGEDNLTYFASGTWTLNNTAFSYTAVTINMLGGTQHTETGTAIYNGSNGTLTNGQITDETANSHSTFTVTRVN